MSEREMLIVLAHAHACEACRARLLSDPGRTLSGRALTEDEKTRIASVAGESYSNASALAEAAGVTVEALNGYQDHPVVRLRHLQG